LVHFDHPLRRGGRHDEFIGVRLDEYPRFAPVSVAQCLARFRGFFAARVEIVCLRPAPARAALATKIWETVGLFWIVTAHRLGHHVRQRVLAGTVRARDDHRVRQPPGREHLAQLLYGCLISRKVAEAHFLAPTGRLGTAVSGMRASTAATISRCTVSTP